MLAGLGVLKLADAGVVAQGKGEAFATGLIGLLGKLAVAALVAA
jgi:hypothetical protein